MSIKQHSTLASQLGSKELPPGVTAKVIEQFYEALDCPRSLGAAILYKYQEYDQLVGLEVDPLHYNDAAEFRDAYIASNFLAKSKFLKTSFDREALALKKFETFEEKCKETNERFRQKSVDNTDQTRKKSSIPLNEMTGCGALLSVMRRKIAKILGAFDPSELFELASWGPGVSTLIKGEETFAARKFQQEVGVTRDLYSLVTDLFPVAYPEWWRELAARPNFPSLEVGNAVVTVPKTSKIDRVIAIEPGLNLWFQLGIGRMIRRRLGRVGIDLTDQTRNQQLARSASLSAPLVTVDLSSASDSIATELVRTLFDSPVRENAPVESGASRWFDVMDLVRSKYGRVANQDRTWKFPVIIKRWEKFSSMGNGFTFDLETLIFYTAACACCETLGVSTAQVSVYGDDIILPSVCYDTFSSLCDFLGFTINPKKSFSSGHFRESCGAHYYAGVDCKPIYLEDELSLPDRVFNFANTLRIRSHRNNSFCEARFRLLFYRLVHSVPSKIRYKVPAILNRKTQEIEPLQGGFISNLDEACPPRARDGIEGYLISHLAWVPIKVEVDYPGLLFARLAAIPTPPDLSELPAKVAWEKFLRMMEKAPNQEGGNENPLRGSVKCVLLSGRRATLVRQWYDLGPWL